MKFKVPFWVLIAIIVVVVTLPPLLTFISQRLATIPTEYGDVTFDANVAVAMINDIKKQTVVQDDIPYDVFSLVDEPEITKISSIKQVDPSALPVGTHIGYEIFWSFDNIDYTEQLLYFDSAIKLANTEWTQVIFYSGVGTQMKVFNIPPVDGTANFFTFLYQTEIEQEVSSIFMQFKGYNTVAEKNVFFSVYYSFVYTYTPTVEETETEATETIETMQLEPEITPFINYPLILLILGSMTLIIKPKRRKREEK